MKHFKVFRRQIVRIQVAFQRRFDDQVFERRGLVVVFGRVDGMRVDDCRDTRVRWIVGLIRVFCWFPRPEGGSRVGMESDTELESWNRVAQRRTLILGIRSKSYAISAVFWLQSTE